MAYPSLTTYPSSTTYPGIVESEPSGDTIQYSTPSRASDIWSHGNHRLWPYYGTIPRGCTIWRDDLNVWHELPEGYEEISDDLTFNISNYLHYRGGREYTIPVEIYDELVAAGFADPIAPIGGAAYPSLVTYPGSTLIPGTP